MGIGRNLSDRTYVAFLHVATGLWAMGPKLDSLQVISSDPSLYDLSNSQ
jgi:hypothetical protein